MAGAGLRDRALASRAAGAVLGGDQAEVAISCPGRAKRGKLPISAHKPTAESVSIPRTHRSRPIVWAHGEPGTSWSIAASSESRRTSSASIAPR